jgi:hypothetical protein
VYVHWIYLPDSDRDPHDHPWPFLSWVLRGGYREDIYRYSMHADGPSPDGWRERRRWSVHRMPIDLAHQIYYLEPATVTLVLVGRRQHTWGFWTPDGFVPWTEYSNADGTRKAGPDPFGPWEETPRG